jgi:hypothetical protein
VCQQKETVSGGYAQLKERQKPFYFKVVSDNTFFLIWRGPELLLASHAEKKRSEAILERPIFEVKKVRSEIGQATF